MEKVNEYLNPYGLLKTDLYVKPTDARSYLNFSSAHRRHIFSGIVYSQCLRLRRIINNQDRFVHRLDELLAAFDKSGYPENMLLDIRYKVQKMNRRLSRPEPSEDNEDAKPVLIVFCHGTDERLVGALKKYEDDLHKTNSFKDAAKPLFQYVQKTGANVVVEIIYPYGGSYCAIRMREL